MKINKINLLINVLFHFLSKLVRQQNYSYLRILGTIYILNYKKKLKLIKMEISGEPIPFIEIIDSVEENGPTTKFEVNPKSVSFLASLKDRQVFKNFSFHSFNIFKKVAIVCIAGPQRTGKSFLANRLLKR